MSRGICATSEPVETIAQAWEMVFSYGSRWKIEESFRFQKCELLIDSLRLRTWQAQRKLLLLVTLAYGSLLAMLSPPLRLACCCLLQQWCQRADWRLWQEKRAAFSSALVGETGSGKPILRAGSAGVPIGRQLI